MSQRVRWEVFGVHPGQVAHQHRTEQQAEGEDHTGEDARSTQTEATAEVHGMREAWQPEEAEEGQRRLHNFSSG